MAVSHFIGNFHQIRPKHEVPQKKILEWLTKAHIEVERDKQDIKIFSDNLQKRFSKILSGVLQIENRGVEIDDWSHEEWSKMGIYRITEDPRGLGMKERTNFFNDSALNVLEKFYPENAPFPDHLIQVTCTGYVSPSAAQQIVSLRGQGQKTTVTHAFHMGCYAAIPAIRMGMGFGNTDVVHTEISSIHMNPSEHTLDQLIVQSLFADGFIKYSIDQGPFLGRHLKILGTHETIYPKSIDVMDWRCEDWGMKLVIALEVPIYIARGIGPFVKTLLEKGGINRNFDEILFAIHPGGPRIINQIAKLLNLKEHQYAHSFDIFRRYGNMSSATMPHIWSAMLEDRSVPAGTPVLSVAFGPGLTLSGALLQLEE